jgi:hypothetical protein
MMMMAVKLKLGKIQSFEKPCLSTAMFAIFSTWKSHAPNSRQLVHQIHRILTSNNNSGRQIAIHVEQ